MRPDNFFHGVKIQQGKIFSLTGPAKKKKKYWICWRKLEAKGV